MSSSLPLSRPLSGPASGPAAGIVYLIGAGPGDPGLLTVRGAELLGRAEVVIYDGLANSRLLELTPPGCTRIYAGKKHAPDGTPLTQPGINELLVAQGRAGKRVVRLKGGDPFVFGRGAEECLALHAAGIRFEIVPGVSSATAVTAYAGIPLTARHMASMVTLATGHEDEDKPHSSVDWHALARSGTVVLFMAWRTAADCCTRLIEAGRAATTPAAAIQWGTTPAQRTVVATLADLPEAMARAAVKPPALLVVGDVVALRSELAWYETRPLFAARVLITRSAEQASDMVRTLAELGAEPITMPVSRIVPPAAADRPALDRALAQVRDYEWVIFTSANGVSRFFAELIGRGRDARVLGRARIGCVGAATASALAGHGLIADIVPARGDGETLARAIIDAVGGAAGKPGGEPEITAAGPALAGVRVLFPRAAEGREEAVHALAEAGAHVDIAPVYRSETVPASEPAVRRGLARLVAGEVDAIAFFAPSQVHALCELLGEAAGERLRACPLIACIGPTTAAALRAAGIEPELIASRPDAMVLAGELAAYYHAHLGATAPRRP